MNFFIRSFWLTFIPSALVLTLALHGWWSGYSAQLPPRPPFPATRANYICDYAYLGSTSHYLFRFGIFGMRQRLQQSDLLLLGASHMEFGLSADQLSQELTAEEKHPIRVYNLGLGFGDSLPFDRSILAANGLHHKAAIVDLFMGQGDGLSDYAQTVEKANSLGAYLHVEDTWLQAADDWFLDPWLPRFNPREHLGVGSVIKPTRMLGMFTTRRWDTGDIVQMWTPASGFVFAQPGKMIPFGTNDFYKTMVHRGVELTPMARAILKQNDLHPVYTLIPFDGYDPSYIPAGANPYLPISVVNLTFYDSMHLNAGSREIATIRLFNDLKNSAILSSRPAP